MNKTILGILGASILLGAVVIAGCTPAAEPAPAPTGDAPVKSEDNKMGSMVPPVEETPKTEDAGAKMEGAEPAKEGGEEPVKTGG